MKIKKIPYWERIYCSWPSLSFLFLNYKDCKKLNFGNGSLTPHCLVFDYSTCKILINIEDAISNEVLIF